MIEFVMFQKKENNRGDGLDDNIFVSLDIRTYGFRSETITLETVSGSFAPMLCWVVGR
jgi:hypothetical protein